ncbi:hypothetical protein [Erythrobacter sp.]|uniref:hypothetical protein n=1 Tax=Erythrobacter sp. TaxID=1042 RepID=UPI0025D53BF0|nr:hypothetical protein [Erythrobacter sp.]
MTAAAQTLPAESPEDSGVSSGADAAAWQNLRDDGDLQFAPVEIPPIKPREPSWFERMLEDVFAFLADLLGPVGQTLGASWWWLQWVLLALVVVFVAVQLVRAFGPGGERNRRVSAEAEAEWQPEHAASLALLEDADRLAAGGRFDEAARLLLQRSVGQIAAARPDWVEPSSTAREISALPALPEAARTAFRIIAERVERSLFALRALDRADWEAARAAYADFALARLNTRERAA